MNNTLAKFKTKDRCNNLYYLTVGKTPDDAMTYRLVSSGGVPNALSNMCSDEGIFPAFYYPEVLDCVRDAIDCSYHERVSEEVNRFHWTSLADKVKAMLRYSLKDIAAYSELTPAEREILDEHDYQGICDWIWSD